MGYLCPKAACSIETTPQRKKGPLQRIGNLCLRESESIAYDDRHYHRRGHKENHMLQRKKKIFSLRHSITKLIFNFVIQCNFFDAFS